MSLFRLLQTNFQPISTNLLYRSRNIISMPPKTPHKPPPEVTTENQSQSSQDKRFQNLQEKINQTQNFDKKDYLQSQQQSYQNTQRKSKYHKKENSTTKFYTDQNIKKILSNTSSAQKLFQLYRGHKFTFSLANMIQTLTKYAQLRFLKSSNQRKNVLMKGDRELQSLLFSLQQSVQVMTNFEKVIVLWSLAKLGIEDNLNQIIIDDLYIVLTTDGSSLTFQEIALATWAMAKRKVRDIKFLKESCNHLLIKLANEKLEIVKNIDKKQVLDKEEVQDKDIYEVIDQDIQKEQDEQSFLDNPIPIVQETLHEDQVEAQSLSLIMWSFGNLKVKDSDLLKTLLKKICDQIDKFSIRMITQILHTMGVFHLKMNATFKIIVSRLLNLQDDLKHESVLTLKILLVGIAKCQVQYDQKEHNIALKIVQTILSRNEKQPLSPRFTSEILYRLAITNYYDQQIFQKFVNNVVINVNQMNIKDVVWCFYSFCKHDQQKYGKVLILLIQRMDVLKHRLEKEGIAIIQKITEQTQYKNKILDNILKIKQKSD